MVLFDVVPTYIVYVRRSLRLCSLGCTLAVPAHGTPHDTRAQITDSQHTTGQYKSPRRLAAPVERGPARSREAEQENTHSKDYNHTSLPHFYISLLSSRVSALEVAQLG